MNDRSINKDSTESKQGFIPSTPHEISLLLIGETIPTVNLADLSGKDVSLNEAVAKKPFILIFYRGGWYPNCSKQLSGIQQIEGELNKMG